MTAFSTLHP